MPHAHLVMCLYHGRLILARVGFPDSYPLDLFGPTSLSLQIYHNENWVSRLTYLGLIWLVPLLSHTSQAHLACSYTIMDYFSHWLSFIDSCISGTFVLCLRYDRFIFTRVGFFLLMYLGHIWLMSLSLRISCYTGQVFPTHISLIHLVYAYIIADFFSCGLDFSNSRILSIFGLCLHRSVFLLTRVGFSRLASRSHLAYILAMMDFFSHRSGFFNSCISSTLGLCLCHSGFLLIWIKFSYLMHLEHI